MGMKYNSTRPYHPNILTISGRERNVGKTTLACHIIEKLAHSHKITALKISPHFHQVDYPSSLIEKSGRYAIFQEDRKDRNKDSSKMLAAGADCVLYIQTQEEYLEDLWMNISCHLNKDEPVIIESGGINKIIRPGLALELTGNGFIESKLKNDDKCIEIHSGKNHSDVVLKKITYMEGHWRWQ
jgi:molybdopterin-guanine dinucleotide biosynthesis protein